MMAAPISAPTSESLNLTNQLAVLTSAVEALTRENKLLWKSIEQLSEDFADHGKRLRAIERLPRPAPTTAKIHEAKLKKVDGLLVSHNNQPITFSDMGKLLGYSPNTRKQNMTHLGRCFKQFPERYEVKDSKLGGKTVRLVPEYLNHILNGGV